MFWGTPLPRISQLLSRLANCSDECNLLWTPVTNARLPDPTLRRIDPLATLEWLCILRRGNSQITNNDGLLAALGGGR